MVAPNPRTNLGLYRRRTSRLTRHSSVTGVRPVKLSTEVPVAVPGAASYDARDRFILTVLLGDPLGRVVRIADQDIVIGRGDRANFMLNDPGLSWVHARVFRAGDQIFVEDLGSTNGTFVRGRRVVEPTVVADADRIRLGGHTVVKLTFADELEEDAAWRLYESTIRDALTAVHNRRYLRERLGSELSFAQRHADTMALLLIDIDHFKEINDQAGHHAGDTVLRAIAAEMQRNLRPEDLLARYGGDEFVVLTRRASEQSAMVLAERLRTKIAALELPLRNPMRVTISVGLTLVGPDRAYRNPEALLASADEAMYEAKQRGRDCVVAR